MNRGLMYLLAITIITSATAQGKPPEDDLIGIYFDQEGSVFCANAFGYPIDAYVIVKNLSHPNDISGWELKVDSDPGISVIATEYYGDGLNIGEYPNYVVGVRDAPLPGGGSAILAKISVIASQEGDLYLEAIDKPSIEDSSSPIYVSMTEEQFVEMNINKPFQGKSQARVSTECDFLETTDMTSLDLYEIDGMREVSCPKGSCMEKSGQPHYTRYTIEDWANITTVSGFSFLGKVNEVIYKCISVPNDKWGGVQSVAFVRFEVLANYWGVVGSSVIVETLVDRPEDCISYDRKFFPSLEEGNIFLVFGECLGNRMRCYADGLYMEVNGELIDPYMNKITLNDPISTLQEVGHARSFSGQAAEAKFVVEAIVENISDSKPRKAAVKILGVLKGEILSQDIFIELLWKLNSITEILEYQIPPQLKVGETYLMFLNNGEAENTFILTQGFHSVFPVVGDSIYEYKNRYWGPRTLALLSLEERDE